MLTERIVDKVHKQCVKRDFESSKTGKEEGRNDLESMTACARTKERWLSDELILVEQKWIVLFFIVFGSILLFGFKKSTKIEKVAVLT